jgi:uracil-DNA glycosylase family 4
MARLFPDNNLVPPKLGSGDILVVAEAPGVEEAGTGEPLVGPSGRLFNSMCSKAGLRREELSLANVLCCHPPENKFPSDPKADYISLEDAQIAIKHCIRNYLLPVLEGHQWQKVTIMGDKALHWIVGLDGITKWRGSILEIETNDIRKRVEG